MGLAVALGSILDTRKSAPWRHLTSGHVRSKSQCDLSRSCCKSVDAPWRDEHCGTNSTSLTHFYQKLLAKSVRLPDDVITWPQMTFNEEMMQQRAGDIKHSLSGYNSGWVGQIWCALEVPHFLHLADDGEVMKLTWPEVADIKKRDIRIVDTYVRIAHCEFQSVWIFDVSLTGSQTLNLRSCHLMWPGGVTFEIRSSKFSGSVSVNVLYE